MFGFLHGLRNAWSTTAYSRDDHCSFAESRLVDEVRGGVRSMSLLLAILVVVASIAQKQLGLDSYYLHSYALVGALCVHIFISAKFINEIRGLYMLGVALLVVSATALVFVAHQTSAISPLLLANVLLLFVLVPMVPWGLREATLVTVAIWILLTSSTMAVAARFGADTLMLLQLFMFTTAFASLALVARSTTVRKNELSARHDLEESQKRLFRLSNLDPLTGAWNRRYLDGVLDSLCEKWGAEFGSFHYVLIDIDDFKYLNDNYGHAAGDAVLIKVTQALRDCIAEHGFVIRLGGDEFCVTFVSERPEDLLEAAVADIRGFAAEVPELTGATIAISYGRACGLLDRSTSMATLYRQADQNMYAAKQRREKASPDPTTTLDDIDVSNFDESGSWMLTGS